MSEVNTSAGSRREIDPMALAGIQSIAPLSGDRNANVINTAKADLGIPDRTGPGSDMAALIRPAPTEIKMGMG